MTEKAFLSNLINKKIAAKSPSQQIDTVPIVAGTFVVLGIDAKQYLFNEQSATLFWLIPPKSDSIWVQYRVLSLAFAEKMYRYRYDSIANFFKAMPLQPKKYNNGLPNEKIINFGNLNYTGSFGRSLSFGNNQDAVVNSLFNLQINGWLGDSIEVAAAITDNNLPILPDGTTQQLNEFDRIWLRFKRKQWELNLGDIDLRQQPTSYLGYYKRQQGIAYQTTTNWSPKIRHQMQVSGAIAKGKFTRNIFQGLEGNQGPYRLRGANNELFFMVLPGTERVFIDGIQMQRGEDQDYTINYNTAEITFTPRQLIQKDKRIQVEFEYADRNYLNSLLYFNNNVQIGKKLKIQLAWYANTDAKNSSINQSLDAQQRTFLSNIGDSLQQAYYPKATPDSFAADKILYIKIDTIVANQRFSIYRYQPLPAPNVYSLAFSEVGALKGNYIPSFNASNGKVFEWVAPVNGQPSGSFEPVALLITPKLHQIATAAIDYTFNQKTAIQVEAAWSRRDINTFSTKDKQNDGGAAFKIMLKDIRTVTLFQKALKAATTFGFERVDATFLPLERLRPVEFLRDWGLQLDAPLVKEQLPQVQFKVVNDKGQSFSYQYAGYFRSDGYAGNRHEILHEAIWKGWQWNGNARVTQIQNTATKGYFLRPTAVLIKTFEKWQQLQMGVSLALEHNLLKNTLADTLLSTAFSFRDWNAWIKSNAAQTNRWNFQYFSRANQLPTSRGFVPLDVHHTFTGQIEWYKNAHHQWRSSATYRSLQIKSQPLTQQKPENTLLGRGEYLVSLLKNCLTANVLYELGAGQEQRRDFSYIEVQAGRGEYTWIDYNNDGIAQLNEFEVAPFPDQAKYIRLFTPTNDFVRATYNTMNYSIQFQPRLLWRNNSEKWLVWLAKWSLQSAFQSNRKQNSDGKIQWNPFATTTADTNLISLQSNWANTLSYNRYSSIWGGDFTIVENSGKAILTYGFETRTNSTRQVKLRWNPLRQWTTELFFRQNTNALVTPNPKFDNRNYEIKAWAVEPKVIFTNGSFFRTNIGIKYETKKGNSATNLSSCTIVSALIEARYNVLQKSVINSRLTYSNIKYDGATNTTTAYILLDALQPGNNLIWNLEFTKRLANTLEVSLNYDGRKAGDTKMIHTGRAALRAIL